MSLAAEDALAALMQAANSHRDKLGHFPAQLRVGPAISRALLRDGATSGSILLYPRDPASWVLVVANPDLAAQAVLV